MTTAQPFRYQFNPARPAVDARGVFTPELSQLLQLLFTQFNLNVTASAADLTLLQSAEYLVAASSAGLSAERVLSDTGTVSWDFSAAGLAKSNVVDGSITTEKLGGDITAAGKALLDDASAAAQLVTLGAMAATTTLDAIPIAVESVNFNGQQATSLRIENRTSDPGSPAVGQIWLRTDL